MGKQPPWPILSKMGEDNDWEPCLAKDVLCTFFVGLGGVGGVLRWVPSAFP